MTTRVLIVDDNESLRRVFSALLTQSLSMAWGGWGVSFFGGMLAWAFSILVVAMAIFFIGIAASPLIALAIAVACLCRHSPASDRQHG